MSIDRLILDGGILFILSRLSSFGQLGVLVINAKVCFDKVCVVYFVCDQPMLCYLGKHH